MRILLVPLIATFYLLVPVSISLGKPGDQSKADPTKEEPKTLNGRWVALTFEKDGQKAPKEAFKGLEFRFDGDSLVMKGTFKDGRELPNTVRIDPKAKPKSIDYANLGTPKNPFKGIYELDSDRLKLCITMGPGERPTDVVTKPGSNRALVEFRRAATAESKPK